MLGETHGCIFWLYTDPSELEQDARILIKRRLVAFEALLGVGGLVVVILSPHIKALHHEIVWSFFFLGEGVRGQLFVKRISIAGIFGKRKGCIYKSLCIFRFFLKKRINLCQWIMI